MRGLFLSPVSSARYAATMHEPPPPPIRVAKAAAPSKASYDIAARRSSGSVSNAELFQRGARVTGRVKGVMMLITILVLVAAAFFLAPRMRSLASEFNVELHWTALWFTKHPWLVIPLALPALAVSSMLVAGVKRPILWMTVATVLVLLPLAFVLLGAFGPIAGMYSNALHGR